MISKKPELLCPAGDWASLASAIENGADSIYFGVKNLNMRDNALNFELSEIKKVVDHVHKNGKKAYLAVNSLIMSPQLKDVRSVLEKAAQAQVDAVILWDMAVLNIAKELGLNMHLSTQASVSNFQALLFYVGSGVKRIVLARECTLDDIKEIIALVKEHNVACEIETFVHGAMCLSISGRCFMSKYTHNRFANKGQCTQPCRREYIIKDKEDGYEMIVDNDYVLSPKDLCSVDFIEELIEAGIHSFKIEGRMRSSEYAAETTSVYREAIDAYFANMLDGTLKDSLKKRLGMVFNRGFSSGFYFGEPAGKKSRGYEHTHEKLFLGEVRKVYRKIHVADVLIRNGPLKKGEEILVMGKMTPAQRTVVSEMQKNQQDIEVAYKGESVGIKIPFKVKPKDKIFLWKNKGDK